MPDIPVDGSDIRAYDPGMEARVARLEADMQEVKGVLSRLEPVIMRMDTFIAATLPHLATKADLAELRAELKQDQAAMRLEFKEDQAAMRLEFQREHTSLRVELAEKPGKAYLWGVLAVLITAYGAGLAALAVLK
jgi:hypothetical protein